MLSKTLNRAATIGIVALVPFIAAGASVAAQNPHATHHDDLGKRFLSAFEVPAGATKTLIPGGESQTYRVCTSAENSAPVSVHYDANKTMALNPGKCQNFETSQLTVSYSAKAGAAHGTYKRGVM